MPSHSYDVIVVGNGAIGGAIALELAQRGHTVARVGGSDRRMAASAAAGAMLGSFGEVTRHTLRTKYGRIKLDSDIRASDMWRTWDAMLSDTAGESDSLYTADGTVVLLNTIGTGTVDTENFRAIRAALEEYDHPYDVVDPDDLDWYSPDPLSRGLRAIFIPGEHAVDASRLLTRLDKAFEAAGGTVIDDYASAVTVSGGRCVGVELGSATPLTAQSVVVAAGARSTALLSALPDLHRRIPPMVSGYGVSALITTHDGALPDHVLRTPNRAFACGLHCVPRPGRTLYLGGTNVISAEPREQATIRDLTFLLECGVNQLHSKLPMAGVASVQVGNRPVTADGFPLLGAVGVEGLFMATGTYRDGLHQSPLIAEYLADLVESGSSGFDTLLGDFAPERAPLAASDRDDIVERATEELLAAGFETDWNLKPEWPELIEEHARQTYALRAAQLHPAFTPPPELLAKLTPPIERRLADYYRAWS